MAWVKAASLDALNANPVVFNHPPRQISLFKVDDRVYAIDNRCPPRRLSPCRGKCRRRSGYL